MQTSTEIREAAHAGVSEMRDRNQDVPKAYSPFQIAPDPFAHTLSDAAAYLPCLAFYRLLDVLQGDRAAPHAVALLYGMGLRHCYPENHVGQHAQYRHAPAPVLEDFQPEEEENPYRENDAEYQRVHGEICSEASAYASYYFIVRVAVHSLFATGLFSAVGFRVEIFRTSEDVDDLLDGFGGYDLVPVSPVGQQFGYAGLYLGENLLAVCAAPVVGFEAVEIVLHQSVGILVEGKRYISYAYFYYLLHGSMFLMVSIDSTSSCHAESISARA